MPRHLRRRRRTPEVARTELLDAAERLFAKAPPDRVGLKDVAKTAGTSHGLITHYFGTYDGLVAAALERRTTALRQRIVAALERPNVLSQPDELVDMLFAAYEDPVHRRLMSYLIASEQTDAQYVFSMQNKGIALVAARVAEAVRPGATPAMRDAVAVSFVVAVAAAFGYAATRSPLAGAIGRAPSPELDRQVRHALAQMVRVYVFGELAVGELS